MSKTASRSVVISRPSDKVFTKSSEDGDNITDPESVNRYRLTFLPNRHIRVTDGSSFPFTVYRPVRDSTRTVR